MSLDKRKINILKAIIGSYIESGEAIGSRTISKKYELGVSPATIRNEMSDLEEMGFLIQPHTSSGRIPTDKAYRYYVDNFKKGFIKPIDLVNINDIKKIIQDEVQEMDLILKNSVRMLSQFTKYTSFIIAPRTKKSVVTRIQLIPVGFNKVLMVIILNNNTVRQGMVRLNKPIPFEHMDKISNILTERLNGFKLEDINNNLKKSIINDIYGIKENISDAICDLMPYLVNQVTAVEDVNVYSDGVENILDFPEYSDPVKAKEFMSFLSNKESVAKLVQEIGMHDIDIRIGHENPYKELKDCSLITATYKFNGKTIGKIGVIGPTRMDYESVINTVKAMSEAMNEIIDNNFSDKTKEDIDG
ncbi:heat-inducible transcription repressor HrcA [Sedimentibacter sp. zth1]|uniref:heat-inducible transcriptional repressor HrcA n=1 Tax=Sedimentibacter sp. zth1 TaxID=2816908 RepID=UPI001A939838|nr:heat-inducible transcriptional repressor HrcA [Sedimentibacter sp. zth1]QSX05807.1 heat-inducible transcription repressor HrcA [Sedimentibacter sp. zth1]